MTMASRASFISTLTEHGGSRMIREPGLSNAARQFTVLRWVD
jgi:hypothetical protein